MSYMADSLYTYGPIVQNFLEHFCTAEVAYQATQIRLMEGKVLTPESQAKTVIMMKTRILPAFASIAVAQKLNLHLGQWALALDAYMADLKKAMEERDAPKK